MCIRDRLFTACSDKDDVDIPGGLALDKEVIAVAPQGGTEQIAIAASQLSLIHI